MIAGLGQDMYKTNMSLDLHFTKLSRSSPPLTSVYLALLGDIGQEGQQSSGAESELV